MYDKFQILDCILQIKELKFWHQQFDTLFKESFINISSIECQSLKFIVVERCKQKVADCNATLLLSAQGAPLAYRGVCTATDTDGDTFVATNGATKPDFSDCTWAMHGATGKYAGVTGGGPCMPGGPITKDGNNSKFSWTGEWVLP